MSHILGMDVMGRESVRHLRYCLGVPPPLVPVRLLICPLPEVRLTYTPGFPRNVAGIGYYR